MIITERKLRRIIRNILKEESSKNSRGRIDLRARGQKISSSEVRSLKNDFVDTADYGRVAGEKEADMLLRLLSDRSQGDSNEIVISPDNREDFKWAESNEPKALIPLFVIEDRDLNIETNIIVFKEMGSDTYYKLRLDGEDFVDSSSPGYHGVDSREIRYTDDLKLRRGRLGEKPDYSEIDRAERKRQEEKARIRDMTNRGRF